MDRNLFLGPLALPWPMDTLSVPIGGTLEAVGRTLVAGEEQARKFPLKLQVRGGADDTDPRSVGFMLRRQVEELMDNAAWRQSGLYFTFSADRDRDAWLMVGGGTIDETDAALVAGEWTIDLADVYIAGRAGTHRPARRIDVADFRPGLVPRDTRGLIRSTDFAAIAPPRWLAAIPGDTVGRAAGAYGRPLGRLAGQAVEGRHAFKLIPAQAGERVSYRPDVTALGYQDLDDVGSVRLWNVEQTGNLPQSNANGNTDPAAYGWRQAFGQPLERNARLSLDNGLVRLTWVGYAAGPPPGAGVGGQMGLVLERYDPTLPAGTRMRRCGAFYFGVNLATADPAVDIETTVVELTPERGVLEIRAGGQAMRVILQRGWGGPRLEVYNDEAAGTAPAYTRDHAGAAVLEYDAAAGWTGNPPFAAGNAAYPGVQLVNRAGGNTDVVALGTADIATAWNISATGYVPPAGAATKVMRWSRARALVLQLETPVLAGSPIGDPANHGGVAGTGLQAYVAGRALARIVPVPTIVSR